MQEAIMEELEKSWNESRKEKGAFFTLLFLLLLESPDVDLGRHAELRDDGEPEDLLVSNPNHQSSLGWAQSGCR
jgi:hypothetical protein